MNIPENDVISLFFRSCSHHMLSSCRDNQQIAQDAVETAHQPNVVTSIKLTLISER